MVIYLDDYTIYLSLLFFLFLMFNINEINILFLNMLCLTDQIKTPHNKNIAKYVPKILPHKQSANAPQIADTVIVLLILLPSTA